MTDETNQNNGSNTENSNTENSNTENSNTENSSTENSSTESWVASVTLASAIPSVEKTPIPPVAPEVIVSVKGAFTGSVNVPAGSTLEKALKGFNIQTSGYTFRKADGKMAGMSSVIKDNVEITASKKVAGG